MREKNERIEELERLNKEKENRLLKKIQKREAIKEKYDKEKKQRFLMEKEKREEKVLNCQEQKEEIKEEVRPSME